VRFGPHGVRGPAITELPLAQANLLSLDCRARFVQTWRVSRWLIAGWLVLPLLAATLRADDVSPADSRSILTNYCTGCHNTRLRTGNLALDELDPTRVAVSPDVWEKVARKLRTREMPPAGARRPDEETYRRLVTSLESDLDATAATTPRPGRVPVHRLNRTEYTNAIRDLLALDIDGRQLIADEPAGTGFDNVASVLTASPALIESYLSAASTVARLAVAGRSLGPVVDTFKVATAMAQDDRSGDRQPFGSRGGLTVRYHFPADGTYTLKAVLKRQLYLYLVGMGEPHQIDLRIDGALLKRFTIGGEGRGMTAPESFAGNTQGDPAWEVYMHTADAGLEVHVPVKAGTRDVSVSFLRQHIEPEGVLQPPQRGFARTTNELYFGEPAVDSLLIGGPYQPSVARDTPSRRKIFICHSSTRPSSRATEEDCARRILTTLAHRAYRRPPTTAEVTTLVDFYRAGRADDPSTSVRTGDFDLGIERGLRRILSSPAFLFRVERSASGSVYHVSDIDLASRLSFFLWSSIPDDELLNAAEAGTLSNPAVLDQQVRRMLRDEKSQALVDNFAMQWLQLGRLAGVVPDVDEFPYFDENLREAMREETRHFVGSQLHDDRSVVDLVTADYSYINERLARHYGVPNVYGSRFRRVAFTDGIRGGLLGQASILTATSYPNRTSPVLRGRWLLETLLGAPPPPPPPDVPLLKENGADGERHSVRERLDAHRKNPGCAICHVRMDPLGFSLENFDALGKWRATSDGVAVDASASLPDGSRFEGVAGLRALIGSHREDFVRTFADRLLSYALGRGTELPDMPAVRKIVRDAAAQDYRWSAIVKAVVYSTPFGMSTNAENTP
jgi:mono/diheme cytochrome c family protein